MHRALRIPELLLLTLTKLDLCEFHDPDRDDERAALAAAATTCTAWKEPALKLLWKKMDDIIPLFKLLAPMKCQVLVNVVGHDSETYNEWKFTRRTISHKAWDRFQYYSAFIQTLQFHPAANTCLRQVYSTITKSRRIDTNFFPNLRDLDLDNCADPNASLPSLVMLLSNGVRKLETYLDDIMVAQDMYNVHIPTRLKHLEDLRIAPNFHPALIERWVKPHVNLRKLSFDVVSITDSLFHTLGDFSQLEELHITGYIFHLSIAKFPPPPSFRCLRTLQIDATLSAWAALLEGGGLPPTLTEIRVAMGFGVEPEWEGEETFARFFQAVADKVPWIESIRLELRFSLSKDHTIQFNDIRSLTSCCSLKSLTIYNASGINLSKDDLGTLLKAWPALQHLHFYFHTRAERHLSKDDETEEAEQEPVLDIKKLSFDVLDLFAEFCQEIEELALPFTDAELRVATLDVLAPLTRLKSLDIFKAEMKFPETVAIYLSRRMTPRSVLHWQEYALVDPSALLPPIPAALLEDFREWRGIELAVKTLFQLRRGVVPRAEVGWKLVGHSDG